MNVNTTDVDLLVSTITDLQRSRAELEVRLSHAKADLQSLESESTKSVAKHAALYEQLVATQREHERLLSETDTREREVVLAKQAVRHLAVSVTALQDEVQRVHAERLREREAIQCKHSEFETHFAAVEREVFKH